MKGVKSAVKIALIPLYVDYYESVVAGIRQSKEQLLATTVKAIDPRHEVLLSPRVMDPRSARAAQKWLRRRRPDCVVVLPLVAAFSALSDEVVKGWTGPLILWSVLAGTSVPRPLKMTAVVAESQAFGAQAVANGWVRRGLDFHVIHQIPGSPAGRAAIRDLLNVIEASEEVPHLRMGLIGEPFEGMTDVELPAKQFSARTGVKVVRIRMRRIHTLMRAVSKEEVEELGKRLSKTFSVGHLSAQEKQISLRAALAIQKTVKDERLACAAFNSHGREGLRNRNLGLMCSLGLSLAASAGCPISEVGDLCTAFAMWLGQKLSGASFYTELDAAYISSHEWLLLNSGEFDLGWLRTGYKPKLLRNTNFEGVNGRGASVCAPLRIGPATIINFTPTPRHERP